MKRIYLLMMIVGLIVVSIPAHAQTQPKNIILFIGDGMGPAQVTAAKTVEGELNMEYFKTTGMVTTHSANSYVTDSAAGGTALASGQKTNNDMVGQTPDNQPLQSVVAVAEKKGKSTGLVVTCSITHATPAAFYAHVADRHQDAQIAPFFLKSGIDVFFGGGWDSMRKYEKKLKSVGLHVIQTPEAFAALETGQRVAGFFAAGHLPKVESRDPSLAEMTEKAIAILSQNKKGFFLMVEGSQIDWGGHENDKDYIISETIDFDEAVGVGIDFAEKSKETLILVTADHETGGMVLLTGSVKGKNVSKTAYGTKWHSGVMVPIFSYGPGSSAFAGIQDNTHIGQTIKNYLGN